MARRERAEARLQRRREWAASRDAKAADAFSRARRASLPSLRATLEADRKSDSDDHAYDTWRDSQAERSM